MESCLAASTSILTCDRGGCAYGRRAKPNFGPSDMAQAPGRRLFVLSPMTAKSRELGDGTGIGPFNQDTEVLIGRNPVPQVEGTLPFACPPEWAMISGRHCTIKWCSSAKASASAASLALGSACPESKQPIDIGRACRCPCACRAAAGGCRIPVATARL